MEGICRTKSLVKGGELDNDSSWTVTDLPPGFRFHPTDGEIISDYLTQKVINSSFTATAIGEVDLNKCEPWDLPKKAKMAEKESYFFCQRDRKYPTGMRTNRATDSGYWKATGKDKEIYEKGKGGGGGGGGGRLNGLVGMKKTLVFYKGRAPKGEKTNWVMHEYRLEGKFSYYNFPKAAKEEWVVCRVFHKNSTTGIKLGSPEIRMGGDEYDNDDRLLNCPSSSSLPPLMEQHPSRSYNYSKNERAAAAAAAAVAEGSTSSFMNTDRDQQEGEMKGMGVGAIRSASSYYGDYDYLSYFSDNQHDLHNIDQVTFQDYFPTEVLDHHNIDHHLDDSSTSTAAIPSFKGSALKVNRDDDHQAILRALAAQQGTDYTASGDIERLMWQRKFEQCPSDVQYYSSKVAVMSSSVSQETKGGVSCADMTTMSTTEASSSVISGNDNNVQYSSAAGGNSEFGDLDYLLNY